MNCDALTTYIICRLRDNRADLWTEAEGRTARAALQAKLDSKANPLAWGGHTLSGTEQFLVAPKRGNGYGPAANLSNAEIITVKVVARPTFEIV